MRDGLTGQHRSDAEGLYFSGGLNMSKMELVLLLLIPVALLLPNRLVVLMRRVWWRCAQISRYPTRMMLIFASLAFAGNMAFSLLVRFPEPYVVDEFSYLFGTETFLAGRLTTPTPPFHQHFRDTHNIETPTWQMKYPPGQSLLLALGGVVGHPIIGAWLGMALAIAGLCWMLLGVLPGRWAFIGTLLGLLNWWIMMRFGQSYRGAALAALGGTISIGALIRMLRTPRPVYGILLAGGLFLLAITRPYEGLICSLPGAALLLTRLASSEETDRRTLLLSGMLPCLLTSLMMFSWLAYYHRQVTGSAFVMPYQVWSVQKSRQPLGQLLSGASRVIADPRHPERRFSERVRNLLERGVRRIKPTLQIYFPIHLAVSLVFLNRARRRPWFGFLFGTSVLTWTAIFLEQPMWIAPEYAAPLFGLSVYLITQGLRNLHAVHWGTFRSGARLTMLLITASLVTFAGHCLRTEKWGPYPEAVLQRLTVTEQLRKDPAKDLVFVNLPEKPDYTSAWVHNHPDFDQSEILWALPIHADSDEKLRQYFRERVAWKLDWVDDVPRLRRLAE